MQIVSKPYLVDSMSQDYFLDFSTTMDETYDFLINKVPKICLGAEETGKKVTNMKGSRKTHKIEWSKIRSVQFDAERPFTMLYKYNLHVPYQAVDIGQSVDKVSSSFLLL